MPTRPTMPIRTNAPNGDPEKPFKWRGYGIGPDLSKHKNAELLLYRAAIDQHMHNLTGAEFKVLMFIVRQIMFSREPGEHIAMSTIANGVKKKDTGEVVVWGTGLTPGTIGGAIKALETKKLVVVKRARLGMVNDVNYYCIRVSTPGDQHGLIIDLDGDTEKDFVDVEETSE